MNDGVGTTPLLEVGCRSGRLPQAPAELRRIVEHAEGVADDVDFGFGRVDPLDREVGDGEGEFAGEEEDFDVEGEAVDLLALEDGFRGVSAEGFEAALGVAEFGEAKAGEDCIEALAHRAARPGLRPGDSRVAVLAVTDEHRDFGVRGEMSAERIDFREGDAQVGVHVKDEFAGGAEHAGADGVAFAALGRAIDHDPDDARIGL